MGKCSVVAQETNQSLFGAASITLCVCIACTLQLLVLSPFLTYSVMYSGLNSFQPVDLSTPQGQVPGSTESPLAAVFFIVYMIVMALILAQLFTGFLIVTFQEDGVKTFRETKLNKNEVSDPGVYIIIVTVFM